LDVATRLCGFGVEVLPLRERREEIVPLFKHFLQRFGAATNVVLEPKLIECLWLYTWPGNVRELEQVARQMQALHGEESTLCRHFLPSVVQQAVPDGAPNRGSAPPAAEQDYGSRTRRVQDQKRLAAALKETNGNVTEAAKLLGFSRQRAYRLMSGNTPSELQAAKEADAD
jgi:DNA-binding NtrC family response regulator